MSTVINLDPCMTNFIVGPQGAEQRPGSLWKGRLEGTIRTTKTTREAQRCPPPPQLPVLPGAHATLSCWVLLNLSPCVRSHFHRRKPATGCLSCKKRCANLCRSLCYSSAASGEPKSIWVSTSIRSAWPPKTWLTRSLASWTSPWMSEEMHSGWQTLTCRSGFWSSSPLLKTRAWSFSRLQGLCEI